MMQKKINEAYKEIFGNSRNFSVFAQFNGFSISLSPVDPNSSHAMSYFSALNKISDDINRGYSSENLKVRGSHRRKGKCEGINSFINSLNHYENV